MKINPKRFILDYYDSLVRRIDIYTEEQLELYTENDRLQHSKYSIDVCERKKEELFSTRHRYQELEEIHGGGWSRDFYYEEYDIDPDDSKEADFVPGTTSIPVYLNSTRDKAIDALRKAEAENLKYYESIKQDLEELAEQNKEAQYEKETIELFKEKLFATKFCFLTEIDQVLVNAHRQQTKYATNACAFSLYVCVCDFYLEEVFQTLLKYDLFLIQTKKKELKF